MQGPERLGPFRAEYNRNRNKILKTRSVCAICGKPVDKSLKYPDPFSPTVDHIIPIAKGGHPGDIDNLQLAHLCCNRQKSDHLPPMKQAHHDERPEGIPNRDLPQSVDWSNYKAK